MGHRRSPPYPLRGAGRWGCPHTHTHSSPLPLPCGGWGGCFPPPPPGRGFCNAAGVVMHGAHRSPGPLQCLRRAPPPPRVPSPPSLPGRQRGVPPALLSLLGVADAGPGLPCGEITRGGLLVTPRCGVEVAVARGRWKNKNNKPLGHPLGDPACGCGGLRSSFFFHQRAETLSDTGRSLKARTPVIVASSRARLMWLCTFLIYFFLGSGGRPAYSSECRFAACACV